MEKSLKEKFISKVKEYNDLVDEQVDNSIKLYKSLVKN